MLEEIIQLATREFKQKMMEFGEKEDLSQLTPQLAESMGQWLHKASQAACLTAYKQFVQNYEESQPTIEHKGKTLRWKMKQQKKFLTFWGNMVIERNLYQADRGGKSYSPLDAKWGMQGEYATTHVREIMLYATGRMTPVETEKFLKKCRLFQASATAIYNIIGETGDLLAEHGDSIKEGILQEDTVPDRTEILAASLDGTNVLLKEPGGTKRRPSARPGKGHGDKEICSTYKNAMVGSLSFYGECEPGQNCPQRLRSVYTARMPQDAALTLKKEWERELDAAEESLPDSVTKILIMDGARGLWKYAEGQERLDDYEKILDFYHTVEHLSWAAEFLFGKQSAQGKEWYEKYYQKLLQEDDAPQAIIRSIDYYRANRNLSKSSRKDLKRERGFFLRNKKRMRYAEFRRRKWPIGSGPVEAACKTIVKQRMCRSGMRWSRQGGQNVLWLRTYLQSDRWELFWKQYKKLKYSLQDVA